MPSSYLSARKKQIKIQILKNNKAGDGQSSGVKTLALWTAMHLSIG